MCCVDRLNPQSNAGGATMILENPERLGKIPPLTHVAPMDRSPHHLARNVTRLSHLDLPGAGQVTVAGDYAYVGHIPNKQQLGTSILDVRDPKNPRVVRSEE